MIQIVTVVFVLALLSILATLGIVGVSPTMTIAIALMIAFVIFGLLFYGYYQWLWKFPLFRLFGITRTPDVSGAWNAKLITSYDGKSRIEEAKVMIEQTWLTIDVQFQSETATSQTLSATFFKRQSDEQVLTYIYRTNPNEAAPRDVQPHIGLCVLRLVEPHKLSGYYHYFYYDDERVEFIHGQLVLERPLRTMSQQTV